MQIALYSLLMLYYGRKIAKKNVFILTLAVIFGIIKRIEIERQGENMKLLTELISEKIMDAFEEAGYDRNLGRVKVSDRPDLCEFQCSGAMAGAKQYGKNPVDIAEDVSGRLQESDIFEKIEVVKPGFININVSPGFPSAYLNDMRKDEKLGYEEDENAVKTVIDYGGANVAKPLHVGHLRSAVIGESVKRILKYAGNDVTSDIHLGDWGLQMGLIIMQLKEDSPDLPYFDAEHTRPYPHKPPFTLEELERIYPKASARSKEDETFLQTAQEATLKLQQGYEPYIEIWKHIMTLSKADLKKNYDAMNVSFDLWKGESDAQPFIPGMIDDLKERGIAHESQGALVVDVALESDKKEIPPCIIQKSDGAALYATSDLATIIDRKQSIDPGRYVYVADKRQELHFTQVFRTAKKAGFADENTSLEFLGFGTMNGKDGKPFKTRAGGVMRLEYLIEDINAAVYDKIKESDKLSGEQAREAVRMIGLAALKYGDLSNQASKDYVFDIDRFTSFEGNTGPYILYTAVRIRSILEKSGTDTSDLEIKVPRSDKEKALFLKLSEYNAVLKAAYEELAPHKICQYIYEISDVFNGFYHDTKILTEADDDKKKGWLALLDLTEKVLISCLDLLGIECPDKM